MPDSRDKPLFLARQGYRQRRVIDAARLLPFLGAFLFLVPVLWDLGDAGHDPGAPAHLAERAFYIFGVWGVLVLAAAALGRHLRAAAVPPSDGPATLRSGAAPRPAPPDARDGGAG